ncbi:3-oxoacyl-[acyl-carrier protein] reductase [Sphingopyxis panaciterrae]|uniref:SDR family NAD(P)-dependent oxidoreductase n=1 Tax=Sphingopyxis panaciterrae TaxID=363841 RepID=UPI0014206D98|nr:SDR family oxidoreductase [Sphingopyxis panaciterrae]NIJ35938.1 3-oxoacyl-[acyl-carrier protein] reductase [Sphingopyxis panaciterrae]
MASLFDAWRLDGRVAFVTGAGGAIGEAVATALAAAGAHVHCADLRAEAVAAVAARIGGTPVLLDVTDRAAVFAAIDAAAADGGLHIVCNLAGIAGRSQRVVDLDEEAFDAMFAAHFGGVLHGCQAALPHLRRAGGAIVNMSSEAIDIAPATIASYAVAKASISSLTRILAAEVAGDGIRVNAVAPSFIPSELSLVRYAGDPEGRDRYLDWWRAKSPLGQLCSVDDVAAQILYLASDAAGYVTGQTLRANGGISMPW